MTTGQSPWVKATSERVAREVFQLSTAVVNRARPGPAPFKDRKNRDLSPCGRTEVHGRRRD